MHLTLIHKPTYVIFLQCLQILKYFFLDTILLCCMKYSKLLQMLSVAILSVNVSAFNASMSFKPGTRQLLAHTDAFLSGCNDISYSEQTHSFTFTSFETYPPANTYLASEVAYGSEGVFPTSYFWVDASLTNAENCARYCASKIGCNIFWLVDNVATNALACRIYSVGETYDFIVPMQYDDTNFIFEFHRLQACATPPPPAPRPCGAGLYYDDGTGDSSAAMRRLLEHNAEIELGGCNEINNGTHTSTFTTYYADSKAWYHPNDNYRIFYAFISDLTAPTQTWYDVSLSLTENCALQCAAIVNCDMFYVWETHLATAGSCRFYSVGTNDWMSDSPISTNDKSQYQTQEGLEGDASFLYTFEHDTSCVTTQVTGTCESCPPNTYSPAIDAVSVDSCQACPDGYTTSTELSISIDNCTAPTTTTTTPAPTTTTTTPAPTTTTTTPAPAPSPRPCGAGLYYDDGIGNSSAAMRRLLDHNSAYELAACNEINDGSHASTYTSYYDDSKAWYMPNWDTYVYIDRFYLFASQKNGDTAPPVWYDSSVSWTEFCALKCASFPTCDLFVLTQRHSGGNQDCVLFSVGTDDWISTAWTTSEYYNYNVAAMGDTDESFVYVFEHDTTCATTQVTGTCELCPPNTYSSATDAVSVDSCQACPDGYTTLTEMSISIDNCTAPNTTTTTPAPNTTTTTPAPNTTTTTPAPNTTTTTPAPNTTTTTPAPTTTTTTPAPTTTTTTSIATSTPSPPTVNDVGGDTGTTLPTARPCGAGNYWYRPSATYRRLLAGSTPGSCQPCPADTYNSVLDKLDSCLSCPDGTSTNGNTGSTALAACETSTSASPSLTPASPTASLARKRVRSKVRLPYTKQTFDEAKQTKFRRAIAKMANVNVNQVLIISIIDVTTANRRLLNGNIEVEFEIVESEIVVTAESLNQELEDEGLDSATLISTTIVEIPLLVEDKETLSPEVIAVLVTLASFCIIFACGWCSANNHKNHLMQMREGFNAEMSLLTLQNSNLRTNLRTMEEAYTSLLEKYSPDDLQPLLEPPEQKLFWVVKPAP